MSNTKQNITVKDVAAFAGVSVATAGRVIGGYGTVSEEKKRKVLEAVKKLHFVPNALAQSMRNRNSHSIAIIVPNIHNSFFSNIVDVAENYAKNNDYNVIICNTHENPELEMQYLEMLRAKQIDGVLLASSLNNVAAIPDQKLNLYGIDIPMVLFDRKINGLDLDVVESAHYSGSYEATKYLIELGHKNIAAIGSAKDIITTPVQDRINGYKIALSEADIPFDEDLVFNLDWENVDAMHKAMSRLLDMKKATAIMILNNSLTCSLLTEMDNKGILFPEDISVISWDDEAYSSLLGITTVEQPVRSIGQNAIQRLFQIMRETNISNEQLNIALNTHMIIRKSCRKIN